MERASRGTERDEAHAAADQLVATAFVLPLLAQARNSPFRSELFDGGRAEAAFGQQLDVIFAENITRAANFGLGDAIAKRLGSGTKELDDASVNQIDRYG
ncbi:MAG: rod-binding protein [Planctomycetota bacterium]